VHKRFEKARSDALVALGSSYKVPIQVRRSEKVSKEFSVALLSPLTKK